MTAPRSGRGLRLLFVHQNFPSQYYHIARCYAADPDNTVIALGDAANLRQRPAVPGVIPVGWELPPSTPKPNQHTHHYVRRFEADTRRGQAAARVMARLRDQGFIPDIILVHPDWGEGLFIRLIWPDAPILAYAEHYAQWDDPALDFDPAFPATPDTRCAAQAANATRAITLADADHLQTPTRFQLARLPESFRARTSLLYDGINTAAFSPDPDAVLELPPTKTAFNAENAALPSWFPLRGEPLRLTKQETVVTFINRTLEPWRGWRTFVRAIPHIQKAHPEAHFVIVGRTGGGYGPAPERGNWRDIFLAEQRAALDLSRLHFTGAVPPETIRAVLTVSRAHVYLSHPFVLSYSPVEAMSCACPLVLGDTEATREIAAHEQHALFADGLDPQAVAEAVLRLLDDEDLSRRLGQAARARAREHYDLKVCLPEWERVINHLVKEPSP
ncbi:glycosyl transferase [Betaproteobacteria bacterium]|nr:glycosyl transferase [Betaproteobacteria bacterium]GHU13807.1 glycosyl transferase [Betaproteobacteria bacterium]